MPAFIPFCGEELYDSLLKERIVQHHLEKKLNDLAHQGISFSSLCIQYPFFDISCSDGSSLFISVDEKPRAYLTDGRNLDSISCGSTASITMPLVVHSEKIRPLITTLEEWMRANLVYEERKEYQAQLKKREIEIKRAYSKLSELQSIQEDLPNKIEHLSQKIICMNMLWGKITPSRSTYFISFEESGIADMKIEIAPGENLSSAIAKAAAALKKAEKRKKGIDQELQIVTHTISQLNDSYTTLKELDQTVVDSGGWKTHIALDRRQAKPHKERHQHTQKKKPPAFHRFLSEAGDLILAGTSAQSNEVLTLQIAKSDDIWFHIDRTSGTSGPHVILKPAHREKGASYAAITLAASIAAWFHLSSIQRHKMSDQHIPLMNVIYTFRKNIFKRKGMKKGEVGVKEKKMMTVRPEKEMIDKARLRAEELADA